MQRRKPAAYLGVGLRDERRARRHVGAPEGHSVGAIPEVLHRRESAVVRRRRQADHVLDGLVGAREHHTRLALSIAGIGRDIAPRSVRYDLAEANRRPVLLRRAEAERASERMLAVRLWQGALGVGGAHWHAAAQTRSHARRRRKHMRRAKPDGGNVVTYAQPRARGPACRRRGWARSPDARERTTRFKQCAVHLFEQGKGIARNAHGH